MVDVITPAGRIVWGNPLIGRPKTDMNNQPVIGKDGKQVMRWSFGLAIPKNQCAEIFAAMQNEAATMYASGTPQNFSYKFKDGDGMDDQGKPFANREGYAGHFVFSVSTEAFAPRIVRLANGAYSDMTEGLKTGDYVRAMLNIKVHGPNPNARGSIPGLYINPTMIEFVGYGEEIRNGPDPMAAFGGQAVALPAGASATPVATGPMPGQAPMMGMQAPGGAVLQGTIPGAAPVGMPGNGVPTLNTGPTATMLAFPSNQQPAPAHDFVQNATGQMPGQAPTQQPGNAPAPGFVPGQGFPGQQ